MQIPLYRRGEVIGYATVDDDAGPEVTEHRWGLMPKSSCKVNGKAYPCYRRLRQGAHFIIFLHHVVLGLNPGRHVVDHANGDTLDARRANLRRGGQTGNEAAKGPQGRNKSGYKGVSHNPRTGKWEAEIKKNKRRVARLFTSCVNDAAIWYNRMARTVHGEFAYFNQIDPRRCTCGACHPKAYRAVG